MTPTLLYYEDIEIPTRTEGPSAVVDKQEMVNFARIWDPVPIHVDEEVAKAAFGGLTAPGVFILALKQRLIHQLDSIPAVIASLGYDEVRFLKLVRPGDRLTLVMEFVEKRLPKSRDDRGLVVHRLSLINQDREEVMSHLDTVLVRRRHGPE